MNQQIIDLKTKIEEMKRKTTELFKKVEIKRMKERSIIISNNRRLKERLNKIKELSLSIKKRKTMNKVKPKVLLTLQIFKESDEKDIIKELRKDKRFTKNGERIIADYYIKKGNAYFIGERSPYGHGSVAWKQIIMDMNIYNTFNQNTFNVMRHNMTESLDGIFFEVSKGSDDSMEGNMLTKLQKNTIEYFCKGIENESISGKIEQLAQSGKLILVIREEKEYNVKRDGVLDVEFVQMTNNTQVETRLNNEFIHYDVNEFATNWDDVFISTKVEYNKAQSCAINAFLNLYAKRFNTFYSKTKLSYTFCWELLKDTKYDATAPFPCSFDELKKLMKIVRQPAYMMSEKREILYKYHPEQDGLKIDSKLGGANGNALYIIYKDAHCIQVDQNNRISISRLAYDKSEETKEDVQIDYMPMSSTIINNGCIVNSFDAFLQSKEIIIKSLDSKEPVYICYTLNNPNESLLSILEQFFKIGYQPIISTNDFNQITKASFKLNNCIISIIDISYGSDVVVTEQCMDISDEQANEFQEVNVKVLADFISNSYKSHYGDGFKFMLKNFKRCPRPLTLSSYDGEVVGVDNIKCYPSILAQVEYIPVFYHDKFRHYKREKIEDLNLYFVRKNVAYHSPYINVLLEDHEGIIYGFVLKKIIDIVDVLYCCVPTFVKPNTLGDTIK
jgi:hypothetical protein